MGTALCLRDCLESYFNERDNVVCVSSIVKVSYISIDTAEFQMFSKNTCESS